MEDFLKKIAKKHRTISLTDRERINMRNNLAIFIDEHPAQAPFLVRAYSYSSQVLDMFSSRRALAGYRLVAMSLVVVLVAGVGTTYAAVSALPGDPLYGIKINVAEPVEHVLSASNESQAQWDVTLANRRLEEAEKLAAAGTLTAQNAQIVQTQLAAVTQNLNASVATVTSATTVATTSAATSSPTQVAAIAQASDAQSDLEASLSAHVQVLNALARTSPTIQNSIAPLVATVRAQAASARVARIAALSALGTDATSSFGVAIHNQMQAAESQLNVVSDLIGTASTNASDTVQVALEASTTQRAIDAGESSLAQGDLKQAFQAFQAMTRGTRRAQIAAQAQADFGSRVTIPAIQISDNSTSTDPFQSTSTSTATSTNERYHGGGQHGSTYHSDD